MYMIPPLSLNPISSPPPSQQGMPTMQAARCDVMMCVMICDDNSDQWPWCTNDDDDNDDVTMHSAYTYDDAIWCDDADEH